MEYNLLMDLAIDLGYELSMSGAETFRVEESVTRLLQAYGVDSDVFSTPNYIMITIRTDDSTPITRMRRIGAHGNNMDSVEKFSNLSRRIVFHKPELRECHQWITDTRNSCRCYSRKMQRLGYFIGAGGFGLFMGGSWMDGLVSAGLGLALRYITWVLQKARLNQIFTNVVASFLLCFSSIALTRAGIGDNVNMIIIGGIMLLIPGIALTNSLRDMISGDIMSGMLRFFDAILVAAAIAAGYILAAQLIGGSLWI